MTDIQIQLALWGYSFAVGFGLTTGVAFGTCIVLGLVKFAKWIL